jgi:excisionase family DNA binding protein
MAIGELVSKVPTREESNQARDAVREITRRKREGSPLQFQIVGGELPGEQVVLPDSVLTLLVAVLAHLAEGNGVTVIPARAELTTQQAADMLNVSRPYLVGLIEKQEIPCRMVGSHRRIRYQDLVEYRDRADQAQRRALDQLTEEAQELKLGYD